MMKLSANSESHAKKARATRIGEMAEAILQARIRQKPIPPLTQTHSEFSLEAAYQVQDTLTTALIRKLGPVSGYKVAFASADAFQKFDINEPVCGRLFNRQLVANGGSIPANGIMLFHIETEVAFVIERCVDRLIEDRVQLRPYIRSVHAGFDIADCCYDLSAGEQTIPDFVANGGGAAYYVLGPAIAPDAVDIDNLTLKMLVDGRNVYEGSTTVAMGSPWNVMLWLARHQLRRSFPLQAGDVVLTSKVASPYKAPGGAAAEYFGDCGPLGSVSCTIRGCNDVATSLQN
jgi:2-keto-4-pentenoate hydratase